MTLPRQIQYQSVFFPNLPQPIPFVPYDSYQGVEARPLQFATPAGAQTYWKQDWVFRTPVELGDVGITAAAWQGSNVRPLDFQFGQRTWQNYLKPTFWWTPTAIQDLGITYAAFQGSNVRPNPQIWALNYLRDWTFRMPKFIRPPRTLAMITRNIVVNRIPFTMTFGISCNYQADKPMIVAFTPDAPLIDSFTADPMQVVTWTPDSPYCKPGQP